MQFLVKVIKNNSLLKKSALLIVESIKKLYMFSINKFEGVKNDRIVFVSFNGKSYSDNPRAISEELHKLNPNMEIVWLFNNPDVKKTTVPAYIKCVKIGSFKALREMAISKYWVDNFCKPLYMYKSKSQVYIQTWHGDRGFKKVLYDSNFVPKGFSLLESNKCDLAVAGSEYGRKKYRSAFQYNGEVLLKGSPRNDILCRNDSRTKNETKKKFGINEEINILLYAPTLRRDAARKNGYQSNQGINLIEALSILEKSTKKKWVCIVRAHSAVKGLKDIEFKNDKVIDGSLFEDMRDILSISDFLITDYSSSAGDFALLKKPIILFQPDREEYIQKDRSFYFDLDSSPYMIAEKEEQLFSMIENLEWKNIPQYCNRILSFYGTKESGEASKKVVNYILNNANSSY